MDADAALGFVRNNHHAVLATHRRGGDVQQSPVLAVADDEGRVLISTRETAMKVRNLRRRPRASICVFSPKFFGEWVQITGAVEIVSLPEAMELLIEYYRLASGEHENWAEYAAAMEAERRCVLILHPEEVGPRVRG